MRHVEPQVFLVGETRVVEEGLQNYLDFIQVPEWSTDAPSDGERLVEVMGRMCYRSFSPGLNPNVTRVREGNDVYIGNILKQKHGSVIEHATVNFIFADVSRVFTHELVRHRAGVAISQESLRFVRLNELKALIPVVIREDEEAMEIFVHTMEELEKLQQSLSDHFALDEAESFHIKKETTSAMRRLAPMGVATVIGWTANFRSLRHVLEMRTAPGAEEEIRLVFGKVGEIVTERYPNIFGDFTVEMVDGLPHYLPAHQKV